MKKSIALISLLLLVVVMTGCIFRDDDNGSSSGSSALIGTWEYWLTHSGGERERYTVTFNGDGTFHFGTEWFNPSETEYSYGTYTISGTIMTLNYVEYGEEYTDKYTFSVSGNKLTMKSVFHDYSLEYTKVKS